MDEAIRTWANELAQKMARQLDRELLGSYTDNEQSDWVDPMGDIDRLLELMKRPVPVAIWFIDRPREYDNAVISLREFCEAKTQKVGEPPIILPSMGMQLRNWSVKKIKKRIRELVEADGYTEEQAAKLFPFQQPGIWVEMSNGPHTRLMTNKEIEEL